LNEDDVIAEHMIPTTFNEETEFLSDSNTNSLKIHYMTFYWKVRKDFLLKKIVKEGRICWNEEVMEDAN
jgi:hypothetical protein